MYGSIGDVTGSSIYLDYFSDFYPAFSYQHSYTNGNGAEVWNGGFASRYAVPFNRGDAIGSGLASGEWNSGSTLEFAYQSGDYYYYYYSGTGTSGYRGLIPADGSDQYIGVRLTIDSALHYGWIGLTNSGGFIDVFAWGYETEPGVAIGAGVPSPGPVGLLAIGAVGALRRKNRAE